MVARYIKTNKDENSSYISVLRFESRGKNHMYLCLCLRIEVGSISKVGGGAHVVKIRAPL